MARPLRANPLRAALLGETKGVKNKPGSPHDIAQEGMRFAHAKIDQVGLAEGVTQRLGAPTTALA
jgi:hypothetical protein